MRAGRLNERACASHVFPNDCASGYLLTNAARSAYKPPTCCLPCAFKHKLVRCANRLILVSKALCAPATLRRTIGFHKCNSLATNDRMMPVRTAVHR